MNKFAIVFLLMLCVVSLSAQTKKKSLPKKDLARESALRGVQLINEGKYDEALAALDSAAALDPEQTDYHYERALIFYSKKNFDSTEKILVPIIDEKNPAEQYFQLLAAAYTAQDSLILAQNLLERAQNKFPHSGMVFNELGRNAMRQKNPEQAITYWETGMRNAPSYAQNYYDAANFWANTTNRIWAIIYGETFMNLEPGTKKCAEMSSLVFNSYKKSLIYKKDTAYTDFCKIPIFAAQGQYEEHPPFQKGIMELMNGAFKSIELEKDTALSIKNFYTLRRDFTKAWFSNEENKFYPNPLFARHKELIDKNYFESYNYWLMNQERPEEFRKWYAGNKESFKQFLVWLQQNPMKLSEKNFLSRPE